MKEVQGRTKSPLSKPKMVEVQKRLLPEKQTLR